MTLSPSRTRVPSTEANRPTRLIHFPLTRLDQFQRFIERIDNNAKLFEDVNPGLELFQHILITPLHRQKSEIQEVTQNLLQRCPRRPHRHGTGSSWLLGNFTL